MTLNGVVYLTSETNGQPTGAVFIGDGKVSVETPLTSRERKHQDLSGG